MNIRTFLTIALLPSMALSGETPSGKNPGKEPTPALKKPITGRWRVSGGAVWRSFGEVNWNSGSSYSAGLLIPSLLGSSRAAGYGSAGPLSGYADREYDNGNVRIASLTDETGDTWNWAYNDGSQINGDAVQFRTGAGPSSNISRSEDSRTSSWNSDETDGAGPYISLDYLFDLKPNLAIGPQFSFMYTGFDVGNRSSNFSGFQERRDYSNTLTDRYGLDGSVPPIAAYTGSFNGPGILLRNRPDSRSISPRQTGAESLSIFNYVDQKLQVDLYTFSLGPQFEYRYRRLYTRLGLGLGLNIADIDATRTETLYHTKGGQRSVYRKWEDRESKADVLPGFYLSLETAYYISQQWSISAFGRFDWNQDISGSVGPSTYSVDMDGWTVGVALSWQY